MNTSHKRTVQNISYQHTLKVLNNSLQLVFYDVTTLYFEVEQEDDLRKTGFSKDGKHQQPQIVLGLLVSTGGYPLAYEIYNGKKYEGDTMLPVLNLFKRKYKLNKMKKNCYDRNGWLITHLFDIFFKLFLNILYFLCYALIF